MNDPYVSYSYIEIRLSLYQGMIVLFLNDLHLGRYGITNGDDLGCQYITGLTAYTGVSLQCVIEEIVNANYAVVRISNYASIFAGINGRRVLIHMPVSNPQSYLFIFNKLFYIKEVIFIYLSSTLCWKNWN